MAYVPFTPLKLLFSRSPKVYVLPDSMDTFNLHITEKLTKLTTLSNI